MTLRKFTRQEYEGADPDAATRVRVTQTCTARGAFAREPCRARSGCIIGLDDSEEEDR